MSYLSSLVLEVGERDFLFVSCKIPIPILQIYSKNISFQLSKPILFFKAIKKLIKEHNVNVLNVTIRKVPKDINALISYAQKNMYGFVVYYKVHQNSTDIQTINAFTRELMEYLISIKATYYLCYGSYYSQSQLTTMYPEIRKLFVLKTQQDPDMLFTNLWYEKYRALDGKRETES